MTSVPDMGRRQQKAAEMRAQMGTGPQPAQESAAAAPAGAQWRPLGPGETLEDVAAEHDVLPEDIWEHPLNRQIRSSRGHPGDLEAGDTLHIPAQEAPDLEPVGEGDYVVREGDCIASIAKDKGHFWQTLWDDPTNARLREIREAPNVLLPGDRVAIPPLTPKKEPGETEMRHRFVRKGEPAALNLRLCVEDQPLANQRYELVIDGDERNVFRGTTDANGNISGVPIPGNAREGVLTVGDEDKLVFHLRLGHMSPKDDVKGVQRRLSNMGYTVEATGKLDSATRRALRRFQRAAGLQVTGEPDGSTQEALRVKHGS